MDEPKAHRDRPATIVPKRVLVGTVVSAFPYANCYMVATGEGEGRALRPALYIGGMGNFGFGAREVCNLVHGTQVVIITTENPFDYIVAAVPLITTNPGATPAEFAVQGGGTHFFTEEILRFPAVEQDGVLNAASGGLLDAHVGEWGMVNELGLAIFLGRFETFLRVDEMCGIWANYVNKTLRLAARDLVLQTYASDDYDGFADGELNATRRRAVYPSESMGVATSDQLERQLPIDTIGTTGRNLVDDRDGTRAAYEPINADRVLLPRLLELEGRNADILQRFVVTPVAGKQEFLQDDSERYLGLLRERYGLDGSYQLHSKNGISIRKVVTIPAPIDVQDLRSPAKEITDQEIAEFDWDDGLTEVLGGGAFAVQALEHHAYVANLASFRNLLGRSEWSVPEADAGFLQPATMVPVPNQREALWQPTPDPQTVQLVGGRAQDMYLANAGIDILPDGTVVIDGPMGERILMGGGNIVLSCPGSVISLPGQHAITWAPGDIIARAKQDVDISATDGDVRVKAERNLEAVAGNGGRGGVLIESKGTNTVAEPGVGTDLVLAGVIVKSETETNVDGRSLTLRAREAGMWVNVEQGGLLSLDAGTIWMDMDNAFSFRTGETVHTVSESITVLNTQNLSIQGNLAVPGTLGVGSRITVEDGGLDVAGGALFRGSIIADGNIAASQAVVGAAVAPSEDAADQVADIINSADTNAAGTIISQLTQAQQDLQGVTDELVAAIEEFWVEYEEVVPSIGFSFRRDDDYTDGHEGFIIPESPWQARLRVAGQQDIWEEKQVEGPDVEGSQPTMPHPGLQTWQQSGQLVTQPDGGLWNPVTQLPAARDSQQAGAMLGALSDYIINAVGRTG